MLISELSPPWHNIIKRGQLQNVHKIHKNSTLLLVVKITSGHHNMIIFMVAQIIINSNNNGLKTHNVSSNNNIMSQRWFWATLWVMLIWTVTLTYIETVIKLRYIPIVLAALWAIITGTDPYKAIPFSISYSNTSRLYSLYGSLPL